MDNIANIEAYFNKNIITGLTESDGTMTATYTYDSKQLPAKAAVADSWKGVLNSWEFSFVQ